MQLVRDIHTITTISPDTETVIRYNKVEMLLLRECGTQSPTEIFRKFAALELARAEIINIEH